MANDEYSPFEELLKRVGGPTKLSGMLGVVPSCVTNWRRIGIPPRWVPKIAKATGIPKHELRPDMWDAPKNDRAA